MLSPSVRGLDLGRRQRQLSSPTAAECALSCLQDACGLAFGLKWKFLEGRAVSLQQVQELQ